MRSSLLSTAAGTLHRLLLKAAKRLEPLDIGLARVTYLEALSAAISAGRLGARDGVRKTADAARRALPSPEPQRAPDLLLDGLAVLHTEGYAAGTPMLKRALRAFRSDELSSEEGLRWLWLACRTAMDLWDDESWFVLSVRQIQLARDAGALTVLPLALNLRAGSHIFAGQFAAAEALSEEADAVSEAIANPKVPHARLFLAAWRGQEAETSRLTAAGDRDATARGEGRTIGVGKYVTAVLYNGLARYDDALTAARQATRVPAGSGVLHVGPGRADRGGSQVRGARSRRRRPAPTVGAYALRVAATGRLGVEALLASVAERRRSGRDALSPGG